MAERKRDEIRAIPGSDYWQQMENDGWRPVAIEWERDRSTGSGDSKRVLIEELPYGLQVGDDCRHLEECPDEVEILGQIFDMLTEDVPLSTIAQRLASNGKTDRDGHPWTQIKVFELLPRVIEVSPQILASREWQTRGPRAID